MKAALLSSYIYVLNLQVLKHRKLLFMLFLFILCIPSMQWSGKRVNLPIVLYYCQIESYSFIPPDYTFSLCWNYKVKWRQGYTRVAGLRAKWFIFLPLQKLWIRNKDKHIFWVTGSCASELIISGKRKKVGPIKIYLTGNYWSKCVNISK